MSLESEILGAAADAVPGVAEAKWGALAVKIGGIALVAAALLGGGFVWGDTHATRVAMEASSKDAQAQVAAVTAGYQKTIQDYTDKEKAQRARGDALAAELEAARAKLAANGTASKEKLSHVVPTALVCDLPSAALDVLRSQPARH